MFSSRRRRSTAPRRSRLERTLPQIISLSAIPRAQLQLSVRIDVEPLHAASARRQLHRIASAGLSPEIGILMIQIGQALLGESIPEGRDATVELRAQLLAELVSDHIQRFDIVLDRQNFLLVQGHRRALEHERDLSIDEECDRMQAAIIRAWSLGDQFEGVAGDAVQADFDAMGRQRGKAIGVGFRDQGPVRKDGHEKSAMDGMFIEMKKVRTSERFASREAEFQRSGLGQFIHDAQDFIGRELSMDRLGMIEAIRVTHDTVQVTTARNLPLAGEGKAIGKGGQLILSSHRSSGDLLNRLDREEILK